VKICDFGLSRAIGANSDYYRASQGGRWPVKWFVFVTIVQKALNELACPFLLFCVVYLVVARFA
jgi:hypothetical protein